jgi:N-acetylglucosaminyl-diphospho-decaprenol L-rhamnosyltransferase
MLGQGLQRFRTTQKEMKGHAMTDVAVIIVNFRTAALTASAARSVLADDEVHEVVILDNASEDGSVEALRAEFSGNDRVRVIVSPANVGFGGGVNLAVRQTTASLLLLLNSDATLRPRSLTPLRETLLSDSRIAVVAPALYHADGQELQQVAHGVFPSFLAVLRRTNKHPPETLWPDWVSGAAMLLRRSDFDSLGGFDPDYRMYLEDVDLCRRFHAMGRKVRRELASGVDHRSGRSGTDPSDRMIQAQTSRVLYAHKAGLRRSDRLAFQVILSSHLLRRLMSRARRGIGAQLSKRRGASSPA